ncbi:RDD domain containing protein [Desulfatibacillum aliphaticivorans]|uniref:RDD domain containing protein n=1 Tax=Desulfatibacillum aliphaticivorans TaxID=218208 RepID=B8FIA3_DESAL|nr:RDD family protein [Desulfatibacillum aliphaticivorans]ACL02670.1 RDD domain containing protein [Desulfatibacillum aliphaticivorans]
MDWYYYQDKTQTGPIGDEEFRELVNTGVIRSDTLVWRAGMENWQEYGVLTAPQTEAFREEDEILPEGQVRCTECRRVFAEDEVIRHGDSHICEDCKPVFLQKLKDGAWQSSTFQYGGFWIRFVAKFIDGIILNVVNLLMYIPAGVFSASREPDTEFLLMALVNLFAIVIRVTYSTYFVGKFGATPGKMACGLKVIVEDGSKVSYLRAFGRTFADMLSQIILYIGYIMAGFDSEKRALHDRICSTRVIKSR